MISGKVWGLTTPIEVNSQLEFHRISAKKGGVCSTHCHRIKWNGFYVVSGKLKISIKKNDYDLVDVTEIGPVEYTKVAPGEFHWFEALEDTEAFEIYWAELNHDDIERVNVGRIDN